MIWKCAQFSFDTRMPIIMGILNVTPDSFSDGGMHDSLKEAIAHAQEMVRDGAQIIDVGGESTRPGSDEVPVEVEKSRVVPVVTALAEQGICVSVDTRHAVVAQACVEAGAAIINDVSGFRDQAMVDVAQNSDVGVVVMHMKGEPKTMQQKPEYDDVVIEVRDYLVKQAEMLEEKGVERDRICIDPGPGFGKTTSQTYELLLNMHEFAMTGYPVMVAISRKRSLGEIYNIDEARDRDKVSAEEAVRACELGACVIRTHNITATTEALKDLRPYAFLALGSNVALVGNPGEECEAKIAQLNQAISNISALPDTQLIKVSSFYESDPAYVEDQDVFVNAVVMVRTGIAPKELLEYLHAIENSLGRTRDLRNGPRTCDIDILDYQQYISDEEVLVLPHPRILERDFVVKPLLEIEPRHVLSDDTSVTADKVTVGAAHIIDRTK